MQTQQTNGGWHAPSLYEEVVYFAQSYDRGEPRIKIGYGKSPRLEGHESYGLEYLAVVPAGYAEEQNLHRHFAHLSVKLGRGKEWFLPSDDLTDYILWLLATGRAARTYNEAIKLPRSPYSSWAPGHQCKYAVQPDGQMTIFDKLPLIERARYAHEDAMLSSVSDDWYTPPQWIALAREVMGSIDLDPASCHEANAKYVKASKWYDIVRNGLDLNNPWNGNVWLNPPYGRGENSASSFVSRLCNEYRSGAVKQAITCLNVASMGALWFQNWLPALSPSHLVARGRVNFLPPASLVKESAAATGRVFTYIGPNAQKFAETFGPHGLLLRQA